MDHGGSVLLTLCLAGSWVRVAVEAGWSDGAAQEVAKDMGRRSTGDVSFTVRSANKDLHISAKAEERIIIKFPGFVGGNKYGAILHPVVRLFSAPARVEGRQSLLQTGNPAPAQPGIHRAGAGPGIGQPQEGG